MRGLLKEFKTFALGGNLVDLAIGIAIGAAFATGAVVAWALGASTAAGVLLGMLLFAATLEAVFALCLGCKVFGLLMRAGIVPEEVCAECADIWSRVPRPVASESSTPG